MKKFLLSSIILLGVCGAASAQSSTGAKVKKNDMSAPTVGSATAPAAAATPQKAAIMPASDAAAVAAPTTSTDQASADATPAVAKTSSEGGTTVNAAGEVVPTSASKTREEKMAAVKAANAQKAVKQQK